MLNNPYCIYCYWEVPHEKIEEVQRKCGDGAIVLRIYDISGVEFNGSNANYYLEIETEEITDRYIDHREPNRTYCMEIGFKTAGTFHCLARSNHITTPRITMSENVDDNWAIQADTAELMYTLSGGFAMELPGSLYQYSLSEGPEQKE
jgi:hypothetical protein